MPCLAVQHTWFKFSYVDFIIFISYWLQEYHCPYFVLLAILIMRIENTIVNAVIAEDESAIQFLNKTINYYQRKKILAIQFIDQLTQHVPKERSTSILYHATVLSTYTTQTLDLSTVIKLPLNWNLQHLNVKIRWQWESLVVLETLLAELPSWNELTATEQTLQSCLCYWFQKRIVEEEYLSNLHSPLKGKK